jgi:LmbE family N-acetylglucosaminyl deacetylase
VIEVALPLREAGKPLRILCLGAHCDDIDIGCGGTLLSLLARHESAHVTWIAFASTPEREGELRASAQRFLRNAGDYRVVAWTFRDGFFPAQFAELKDAFESLKGEPNPDVIFTHHRDDLHQDHRLVSDLTWNTFRRHLVLEYEVPKYEGGLTTPTAYVALDAETVDLKSRILMECYKSQSQKRWFTAETFRAVMRLRGIESGADSGWAEGFHARKLLLR